MKKIKLSAIIFFTIISITSCDSLMYHNVKGYERVVPGMSVDEFLIKHSAAKNVYLDANSTIYSIQYYEPMGSGPYNKFYYFENNKLIRVDKGERSVDYRIKID